MASVVQGQSTIKELQVLPVGNKSISVQNFKKSIKSDLDGVATLFDTERLP